MCVLRYNGQKGAKIEVFTQDNMAILCPIGLKIGLPITLDSNDGQNKLWVGISRNVVKMANKWLKNSCAATFGQYLDGHNSVIFDPIWKFILSIELNVVTTAVFNHFYRKIGSEFFFL